MSLDVLIVDDDHKFAKLVEIRLLNWRIDLKITHVSSLNAARDLLKDKELEFSLVVLDQHLPDGMGHELADHPGLNSAAILAVSADASPDLPAQAVEAGAKHFLGKRQISEPLFIPLVRALLSRKRIEAELMTAKIKESRMDTIKTLLGTLRHEINNPLGAVLGGAFILKSKGKLANEQNDALRLIEESGRRITEVINSLCEAAELEEVTKGQEQVFQVPGDPTWEDQ